MKKLMLGFTALLMSGAFLSASANPGGETKETALTNKVSIEEEVFTRVFDVKDEYFNFKDATVEVTFFVNSEGDVAVEAVKGNSKQANKAVVQELQENKLHVAKELQNMRHTITLRYVAD